MDMFSIYVLTYKNIQDLDATIKSLYEQAECEMELLVSDDYSEENTDFTLNRLESIIAPYKNRFKQVIINVNKENYGTVKHLNKVLPMLSGKKICLLGSGDELYSENTLKNVNDFMDEVNANICTSKRIVYVKKNKNIVLPEKYICKLIKKSSPQKLFDLLCRDINYIYTIGTFFRRTIFDKYGMFDEDYRLLEDAPFVLKILLQNEKLWFYDKITCVYRRGGISNRKNKSYDLEKDAKTVFYKLKYANKDKLCRFTKRVIELKFILRNKLCLLQKLVACLIYFDATLYLCIFFAVNHMKIKKLR